MGKMFSLKCQVSQNYGKMIVRKRLIANWEYVCKKHKDKKEIIKHFVNLSKQEGRGDVQYQTPLKGVFTEDMGKQLWSELLKCYEIR